MTAIMLRKGQSLSLVLWSSRIYPSHKAQIKLALGAGIIETTVLAHLLEDRSVRPLEEDLATRKL